jgi:hypothetical protein
LNDGARTGVEYNAMNTFLKILALMGAGFVGLCHPDFRGGWRQTSARWGGAGLDVSALAAGACDSTGEVADERGGIRRDSAMAYLNGVGTNNELKYEK